MMMGWNFRKAFTLSFTQWIILVLFFSQRAACMHVFGSLPINHHKTYVILPCHTPGLLPITLTIFYHNWNLIRNLFKCNSVFLLIISVQFFSTWRNSCAVVSFAKFCSDHYIMIWIRVKLNLNYDGKYHQWNGHLVALINSSTCWGIPMRNPTIYVLLSGPTWIVIELNWKKWIDPSPDQVAR